MPDIIFDLLRMQKECLSGIEMNETEGQNRSVPKHGRNEQGRIQVSPDSLHEVVFCHSP